MGFMTPRRFNIDIKSLSWKTQHKSKVSPLSTNPEKWSNTLKQIVGKLPTICLSVFDHFMNLALKGLELNADIIAWTKDIQWNFQLFRKVFYS